MRHSWVNSLAAGDAGETAVGESGTPAQGASDGGAVRRGLLLEVDADTAARGFLERLLGLVGEVVVLETVNEEQSGYNERASLSAALAQKRTLLGGGALEVGDLRLLEDGGECAEAPSSPISLQ